MASGRAYTKSGSTEKYESGQWSTPSWSGTAGSVSTPDSSGNYTVTAPTNYTESTSSDYSVTCTTKYGGVSKVFYFKQYYSIITFTVYSIEIDRNYLEVVVKWEISKFNTGKMSFRNDIYVYLTVYFSTTSITCYVIAPNSYLNMMSNGSNHNYIPYNSSYGSIVYYAISFFSVNNNTTFEYIDGDLNTWKLVRS